MWLSRAWKRKEAGIIKAYTPLFALTVTDLYAMFDGLRLQPF
jgi:hypothetical protein